MKESEKLKEILDFFRRCPARYQMAQEEVRKEDKRTQDILHRIELEAGYNERCKLATQLRDSRKTRRKNKDIVEELEPVMEYLTSNKKAVDAMGQLLGKMRKVEKYHESRSYHPRIER